MRRVHRILAFLLIGCLLILPGFSWAGGMEAFLSDLLNREQADSQAVLSLQVKAWAPFDETRTEDLNRILGHVALGLQTGENVTALRVKLDGEPVLGLDQREESGKRLLSFSVEPDTVYEVTADSEFFAPLLGGNVSETADVNRLSRILDGLREGYSFFASLPEACGERAVEAKVNSRTKGFDTVKKKVTISFTADEVKEGAVHECLADASPPFVTLLLRDLVFRGRQRVVLLFTEEGQLIKINYSGQVGTDADKQRTVSLEWKALRTEDRVKDELTLKTPSVRGNARNNLTVSRDMAPDGQGAERMTFLCRYDRVKDRIRTLWDAEADLALTEELTGSIRWKLKTPDETAETEVIPALRGNSSGEVSGTLEIIRHLDTIYAWDLLVNLRVSPGTAPEGPAAKILVQADRLTAEAGEQLLQDLREKIGAAFLRGLMKLPAEDLVYLTRDLPADSRARIENKITE